MASTIELSAPARRAAVSPVRDRIARWLMWLAAVGAAVSAAISVSAVWQASSATTVVQTWQAYGYLVFAGLFVLLARHPRRYRGVWELVIANKVALTGTALGFAAHGGVAGTSAIIIWDGGLSVVLIVAYVLCRGWSRAPRATDAG
jgi:peptidoglycan/LPS O-acetylase OafA/YrhL